MKRMGFRSLLIVVLLLQLCHAERLTGFICTVIHGPSDDGKTIYTVPEVSLPHCDYSWANATNVDNTVIANNEENMKEVVKSNNISSLITSKCFDRIIFQLDCVLQNIHHKVNCTTVCKENASLESKGIVGETSNIWIVVVSVSVISVILVINIICYIFRNKIRQSGFCSCSSVCQNNVEKGN